MDQLTYDLMLPEDDGWDFPEAYEPVIDEVAEQIFQQDWEGAFYVIANNAKKHRLGVESFLTWLAESCTDRTMAIDVLAGANLRLHAKECATDFVEYCVANYNIWA